MITGMTALTHLTVVCNDLHDLLAESLTRGWAAGKPWGVLVMWPLRGHVHDDGVAVDAVQQDNLVSVLERPRGHVRGIQATCLFEDQRQAEGTVVGICFRHIGDTRPVHHVLHGDASDGIQQGIATMTSDRGRGRAFVVLQGSEG